MIRKLIRQMLIAQILSALTVSLCLLIDNIIIGRYLGVESIAAYKKWISSLYTPLSWNYQDDWYIWQYLNRGELEGYSGGEQYIDLNVLNNGKSIEDLIVQ